MTGGLMPAPCWSCGTQGACRHGCACAKCVDPDGYDEWRYNHPREYGDWLRRSGFDTSCDRCGGDKYPVGHLQHEIRCSYDLKYVAVNDPGECCCA